MVTRQETVQAQLYEINGAISKILTGAQSYGIGNRSAERARLDVLLAERKRLELELERAKNGNKIIVKRGVPY